MVLSSNVSDYFTKNLLNKPTIHVCPTQFSTDISAPLRKRVYWTSSRTYDLDNYASTAKSYHPFQIVRFLLHSMYVCCGNGSSRYGSFTPQIGINQERELNATHFTIFDPTLIRVDMCRCYQLVEARSLATNRNVSYYTFCNVYMYIFEVSQRVPRYSFMYMLRLKMIILIMVIIDEGNSR